MKLPNLKTWRRKSSKPEPILQQKASSQIPTVPETFDSSRRPASQAPTSPDFAAPTIAAPTIAAPTIDVPSTSHIYRKYSPIRAYVQFVVRVYFGKTPPERLVLVTEKPIPMVIKYGTTIQLSEASTLRFLAKKTSVPVPKVKCAFEHNGAKFIVMQYVEGESIGSCWPTISEEVRVKLLQNIKAVFEDLRKIPHPQPGTICSATLGPLQDRRIQYDEEPGFGPFADEKDFNNFLCCGVNVAQDGTLGPKAEKYFNKAARSEIRELISIHEGLDSKICFTHGDAHCENILVRGEKVVALLDLEMAGFYPDYWEYTKAMTTATAKDFDGQRSWREVTGNFLEEYPMELEMERLRHKLFGRRGFREDLLRTKLVKNEENAYS